MFVSFLFCHLSWKVYLCSVFLKMLDIKFWYAACEGGIFFLIVFPVVHISCFVCFRFETQRASQTAGQVIFIQMYVLQHTPYRWFSSGQSCRRPTHRRWWCGGWSLCCLRALGARQYGYCLGRGHRRVCPCHTTRKRVPCPTSTAPLYDEMVDKKSAYKGLNRKIYPPPYNA